MPKQSQLIDPKVLPIISAATARHLLLDAQGLNIDQASSATPTSRTVTQIIEKMGFVQIDTISTVERAHHLILAGRLPRYRPVLLARATERDRKLFEHWTHDASIIPLKWYPHWHFRFERYRASSWHRKHLGDKADAIVDAVLKRIDREGPLSSRDFEHSREGSKSSWWGWKPQKVALDYLWRIGVLHVAARKNFHKVYDLTQRVVPKHATLEKPDPDHHIDWACRTALERLGTATVLEIAQFWRAISITQVKTWLNEKLPSAEVISVLVESADGSKPVFAYALPDLNKRIASLTEPPTGMRLLCPFDPVLRDRARAKRLFNFDFRFEGFVPAAQRTHGYYVMAILDGDKFVGKADPKFDRTTGTLKIGKIWWEAGTKPTKKRAVAFEKSVERLASWIGADRVKIES